ncbi:hypothetical protein [Owenweeksia hongkongensis]|uniref:hypothetical protein n=1 Tax=Owenweeksia hongkongensis TaxID=253245 RepID=UPI003A8D2B13
MEAIDNKILLELKDLPAELKRQALAYIQSLRASSYADKTSDKKGLSEPTAGYGGAKKHISLKEGWDDELTDLFDL